jgi:ubiquitin-protein ligase
MHLDDDSTTTMKEYKPHHKMNTNTKTMTRREQVVISRLRTGYTRATYSAVMDKEPSPFCSVNLTIDHILWHCKETETKRLQMDITKEIWKGGRQEMEKLITYVKEIELFDGI